MKKREKKARTHFSHIREHTLSTYNSTHLIFPFLFPPKKKLHLKTHFTYPTIKETPQLTPPTPHRPLPHPAPQHPTRPQHNPLHPPHPTPHTNIHPLPKRLLDHHNKRIHLYPTTPPRQIPSSNAMLRFLHLPVSLRPWMGRGTFSGMEGFDGGCGRE